MQAGGTTLQVRSNCRLPLEAVITGAAFPAVPSALCNSSDVSFRSLSVTKTCQGQQATCLRVKGVKNLRCLWGKDNNESDKARLPSIHLPFNSMIMGTT